MDKLKSKSIKAYITKIDSYLKGMNSVPSRNDSYLEDTIVTKLNDSSDLPDEHEID